MNKLFSLLMLACVAVASAVDVTLQDVQNDLAEARRLHAAAGLFPDPSKYGAALSGIFTSIRQAREATPEGSDMEALDRDSAALRLQVVSEDVMAISQTLDVTAVQSLLLVATEVTEQITAELIAATWDVTDDLLPGRVSAASVEPGNPSNNGSPSLQRAMFGPVSLLLKRNAVLPAGAAHLENARRGRDVIQAIYQTISAHPTYLGDGQSADPYKETYTYTTQDNTFHTRINRFNVPWTVNDVEGADLNYAVAVGPEMDQAVANIRIQKGAFDLFLLSNKFPKKIVDLVYWMAKPNFISDAVSAPFAQRILSKSGVSVSMTAMTVARKREAVEKSIDMTVSVVLSYSVAACNLDMENACRPQCMLWDDDAKDYTLAGVMTEQGPTEGTVRCGLGKSGLVVVVAQDKRSPVPKDAARVRIFIPDIPVFTTPTEKTAWEKAVLDEVNAAIPGQEIAFVNVFSETGNAANGGIATFFDIMPPVLEPCPECTRENNKERFPTAQGIYEELDKQASTPTSLFRDAQNVVGSQTDEFSLTQFCETPPPGEFQKRCLVAKSASDDSDTKAVMIIAIVAGCIAVVAAVGAYMKFCRKDKAASDETSALV
jgi:hypothetical protein